MGGALIDTVAEMKAWHGIYDPANEDSITNADCVGWINTARRRLLRKNKLRFSEATGAMVPIVGTAELGLPTGWINFTDLYRITSDNERFELGWYSNFRRFKKKFPDPTLSGDIIAAAQWGTKIYFAPKPSAVVSIQWSGHVFPGEMAWGEDEDSMMAEMREAIMFAALVLSGEHQTVPARKLGEWKTQAREEESIAKTTYRTSKTSPGRIISNAPGTIITPYEEE